MEIIRSLPVIVGEFLDCQLVKDVLYLWDFNGDVSSIDYQKIMEYSYYLSMISAYSEKFSRDKRLTLRNFTIYITDKLCNFMESKLSIKSKLCITSFSIYTS